MTRQEAEQILIHYDDLVWQQDNHITCGMISDALNIATEALNPWHKVSEELPKEDGIYIVMLGRNSFVCALDFDAISKQWSIAGYQNDVKYWMEIPEIEKRYDNQR